MRNLPPLDLAAAALEREQDERNHALWLKDNPEPEPEREARYPDRVRTADPAPGSKPHTPGDVVVKLVFKKPVPKGRGPRKRFSPN